MAICKQTGTADTPAWVPQHLKQVGHSRLQTAQFALAI